MRATDKKADRRSGAVLSIAETDVLKPEPAVGFDRFERLERFELSI